MVTEYGAGTTMSCPNRVVAPPPIGQVIDMGVRVAGAGDAGDFAVGPATPWTADDAAGLFGVCPEASGLPAMPAITPPIAAPPRATAPITTPRRWFRFLRAARA